MKKFLILLSTVFVATITFAQNEKVAAILDSIKNEADIMYQYEKSVWVSLDKVMDDDDLRVSYGGYVVWHSNDTICVTYTDKTQQTCIARYRFKNTNPGAPINFETNNKTFSALEKELISIKAKLIDQANKSKYELTIPNGYNPNYILIKQAGGYKLYVIMGTQREGSIPQGNDYLFWADGTGKITNWKKFHSVLVPIQVNKVASATHSHLKTTPYITATEICTFRLYAENLGFKEFKVFCTTTQKYYKYLLDSNTIVVEER